MSNGSKDKDEEQQSQGGNHDEQKMDEMLQELRILLQGVQVLTSFLIILPFSAGFEKIDQAEKWVYLVTFICSVSSLVLFSAPAAQHRLERPLMDRVRFKEIATRMIIIGMVPFSLALVLVSQLVVSEVLGMLESFIVAGVVGALIVVIWWIVPLARKQKDQR